MFFDENKKIFYLEKKMYLDASDKTWHSVREAPGNLVELTKKQAIEKLQQSKNRVRIPIGIVGTNKPTNEQYQLAESIGKELGSLGLSILCGGRAGVMEAVCKGVDDAGGISIGLLPETNIEQANKFVTIPLASGIGFARGSLIASASLCLIAIGGGNGTLVEVASGLQFGKKVFAINSNFNLQDLYYCNSTEEIINHLYLLLFNIDDAIGDSKEFKSCV